MVSQMGCTEPAVPASCRLGLTGTDKMERYRVRTFLTNMIFHKVPTSVMISSSGSKTIQKILLK